MAIEIIITEININPHEINRHNQPLLKRNKIYVSVDGETLAEDLINRKGRPYNFYKGVVLPKVIEKLKSDHPQEYKKLKHSKWSWCPCSPGFISDNVGIISIYITFKIIK